MRCSTLSILAGVLSLGAAPALAQQVIWDFGPNSGTYGGCWANFTGGQNFAEEVMFNQDMDVTGIDIWTCIASASGDMHIKFLNDNNGEPGSVLTSWDQAHDAYVPDGTLFKVSFDFAAVTLAANTRYWIGVSGNGWELGQASVQAPGDGRMAQFNGPVYGFMTGVGDQMFQLRGDVSGPALVGRRSGPCPGVITIHFSGATPNRPAALVFALNQGSFTIGQGPCTGTQLGLGTNQLQQVHQFSTGANGSGQFSGNAPQAACNGHFQIVVSDGSPCATSNVF